MCACLGVKFYLSLSLFVEMQKNHAVVVLSINPLSVLILFSQTF
jgi:hypothetical protein